MKTYKGKNVEGTLKVGQVWRDSSNGEPDITILQLGEKLSTKGCCQMSASHDHLHSKVKAITEMGGEKEHWDAENLLDYLFTCCYDAV